MPGHRLASGFKNGAAGSFSNVACINPNGAVRWFEQMHTDLPASLELESRIQKFMTEQVASKMKGPDALSNQAADKLLASVGGWGDVGTRVRFPYHSFPASYVDEIRPIARRLMPELVA